MVEIGVDDSPTPSVIDDGVAVILVGYVLALKRAYKVVFVGLPLFLEVDVIVGLYGLLEFIISPFSVLLHPENS